MFYSPPIENTYFSIENPSECNPTVWLPHPHILKAFFLRYDNSYPNEHAMLVRINSVIIFDICIYPAYLTLFLHIFSNNRKPLACI
jgi:hypothetical protein